MVVRIFYYISSLSSNYLHPQVFRFLLVSNPNFFSLQNILSHLRSKETLQDKQKTNFFQIPFQKSAAKSWRCPWWKTPGLPRSNRCAPAGGRHPFLILLLKQIKQIFQFTTLWWHRLTVAHSHSTFLREGDKNLKSAEVWSLTIPHWPSPL